MSRRPLDPDRLGDLGDLRAFCLVVDLGSITAAAKRLGETKGSVSRRVTRLEGELGSVLLRRSPRLVQATEDGLEFRARVGRALELLDDAAAQVRGAHDAPQGHLRVTAPTDLALTVLPALIGSFTRAHPKVTVEVVLTAKMLDFDGDEIDVALRASTKLEDSSLVAHKLCDVEGRFYASPAYHKARGLPEKPTDLSKHALVLLEATRGKKTLRLSKGASVLPTQIDLRAAITSTDYAFSRAAALAGAGVTLLPSNVAAGDVAARKLVPVMPGWSAFLAKIYLIHRASRLLPPKVRAFRDHVLAAQRR